MSTQLIQIKVEKRQVLGKKVKNRRRAGFIPANIVAKGKPSLPIEIETAKLIKILDETGYTQALELVVNNDKITALVTDVTFAPAQDIPEHVVFFEFTKGERINVSVPLVLRGESPGEKRGLIVLQMLSQLEVDAPALQIPDQLEVDIRGLDEPGDVVRISDLSLPAEVEIDIDLQTPIVKLERSRSQVSLEAEEEMADGDEASESEAGEDGAAEGGEENQAGENS